MTIIVHACTCKRNQELLASCTGAAASSRFTSHKHSYHPHDRAEPLQAQNLCAPSNLCNLYISRWCPQGNHYHYGLGLGEAECHRRSHSASPNPIPQGKIPTTSACTHIHGEARDTNSIIII